MSANLFSIPPGRPFLKTLAEALLDGRLVKSFRHDGDPLALADVTIYLPTRRAARALAGVFTTIVGASQAGGASAILPTIRPIGEGGDEALFTSPQEAGAVPPNLQPVMGDLERRLHLARLARRWREEIARADFEALIGESPVLPASAADALWLARDLGALLDEMETEGTPFSAIAGLGPEALAKWWQLTLTFLAIVTEHWPNVLAGSGQISEAAAKNAWLHAEAARFREKGSRGPVILAGSTATAPATMELMRAIAHLENGAVVLPGVDRHLDARSLAVLAKPQTPSAALVERSANDPSIGAPGHPQYGLKTILDRTAPGQVVVHLGERVRAATPADTSPESAITTVESSNGDTGTARALDAREAFLADALRPAETTDAWAEGAGRHGPEALDGIALIEAADAREEALAIAVAMRRALEVPQATAALITPDRNLARRVVAELSRFGIAANDSAGRPLSSTAPGTLMAAAIAVALSPGDPIALVSLLKHPLTRLGLRSGDARRAARSIEMIALRGSVGIADGARLATTYAAHRAALETTGRGARPVKLLPEADRDLGQRMADALEVALAPLTAFRSRPLTTEPAGSEHATRQAVGGADHELAGYAVALTRCLEALAADEAGGAAELYAGDNGRALAGFLSGLVEAPATGFSFAPSELGDVIAALAAGIGVQPRAGLSARAFVWGTLEARLQSVDTAILAGLNEGKWPAGAKSGAFLSRLMRREILLDPPERRIGLSAHDFWMAMGARKVVLTRSRRADGAPAIASRWLQRIETLAGPAGAERLRAAGAPYLAATRSLDTGATTPHAKRPKPRPPLDRRPDRYSVTEVETLIRDPYAIHARKILKLEPLPELMRDPHAAERGSLFHDILGNFVAQGHDPMDVTALDTLIAIAREKFAAEALPPDIEAVWWPRMEALAGNYLDWERDRDVRVALRHAEIGGAEEFADIATTLTGRADRIDLMEDGSIEILDFKTGTTPSVAQARALLAPQLPLEGAMVKRGAFQEIGRGKAVSDLVYVRLRERTLYEDRLKSDGAKRGEPVDPDDLSEEALAKFRQLVAYLKHEQTPFESRKRPFMAGDFSGDYDHLARAQEWSIGAEDGGEGSGGAGR